METETKKKSVSCVLWASVAYIVISIITAMFSKIRNIGNDGGKPEITVWIVLEVFFVPLLFLLAGYIITAGKEYGKIKTWKILFGAVLFSGLMLALWYVLLEIYVLLNLPANEGILALDLFLRKTIVLREYEYLYLSETNGYRYVILPLIHFVIRVVHWLFFLWGNRWCVAKRKARESARR